MKKNWYEEEEIMDFLGYSRKSMQTFRSYAPKRSKIELAGTTKIPPCTKVGSRWVYPKDLFNDWAAEKGFVHLVA